MLSSRRSSRLEQSWRGSAGTSKTPAAQARPARDAWGRGQIGSASAQRILVRGASARSGRAAPTAIRRGRWPVSAARRDRIRGQGMG
jgi:hypothetical protein